MLTVEEAQARALEEVTPLEAESVPFEEAFGRVLREDVAAPVDAPERDNSAMDGYAVRAEDLPGKLRVIGTVAAGYLANESVERGAAMRIMTGAYVPDGADTVVQVELTDGGLEEVEIRQALARGANIRKRGDDMREGEVVLRRGARIGAAEIALLAGVQKTSVSVGRKPTVAILSTGDELIDVAEPRVLGKIVNTNAPLLAALVRDAGATPQILGIVRDTRDATIEALRSAAACDFILTSGGVSVGAFDFVKEALESLGAETKFWRVAMKPGKPVVLSRLGPSVCFGLPGNPVSCFVSFHLFVAPALRKASGQQRDLFPPMLRAQLTAPLRAAERRVYFRVRLTARDGALFAEPLASQGSGSLTSMIAVNGLAMVEANTRVEAGAAVPALVIGPVSGG
ncbi:MAG TPA: gephyrin-like molybdotransferase Glp [Thermoanaerobaculia bacterium]|nr:gephyrin-like molybdotransferase Glp [Thermoanaerobaculia bacterium]